MFLEELTHVLLTQELCVVEKCLWVTLVRDVSTGDNNRVLSNLEGKVREQFDQKLKLFGLKALKRDVETH